MVFWKESKWPCNTIHPVPRRNPCRLYIHLAFTYSVDPSSVAWRSELRPAPPFPPMRAAWSVPVTGSQSRVWSGPHPSQTTAVWLDLGQLDFNQTLLVDPLFTSLNLATKLEQFPGLVCPVCVLGGGNYIWGLGHYTYRRCGKSSYLVDLWWACRLRHSRHLPPNCSLPR